MKWWMVSKAKRNRLRFSILKLFKSRLSYLGIMALESYGPVRNVDVETSLNSQNLRISGFFNKNIWAIIGAKIVDPILELS